MRLRVILRFNSKLVRLEVQVLLPLMSRLVSFNSKLVRLEDQIILSWSSSAYEFQFQTGSIRSPVVGFGIHSIITFQFQTGSIRSQSLTSAIDVFNASFNSKLVRLEVCMNRLVTYTSSKKCCFNSKLVRLEGYWDASEMPSVYIVSIPNWFD